MTVPPFKFVAVFLLGPELYFLKAYYRFINGKKRDSDGISSEKSVYTAKNVGMSKDILLEHPGKEKPRIL
ncbi:MAG: hypothetical protein KQH63_20750 [Desulfobulbaceae bacterium]|nr:hypothetical protein [Desulfobulbaceae bacterium]